MFMIMMMNDDVVNNYCHLTIARTSGARGMAYIQPTARRKQTYVHKQEIQDSISHRERGEKPKLAERIRNSGNRRIVRFRKEGKESVGWFEFK